MSKEDPKSDECIKVSSEKPKLNELYKTVIDDCYKILKRALSEDAIKSIEKQFGSKIDEIETKNRLFSLKFYIINNLSNLESETYLDLINFSLIYINSFELIIGQKTDIIIKSNDEFCLSYIAIVGFRCSFTINFQDEGLFLFQPERYTNYYEENSIPIWKNKNILVNIYFDLILKFDTENRFVVVDKKEKENKNPEKEIKDTKKKDSFDSSKEKELNSTKDNSGKNENNQKKVDDNNEIKYENNIDINPQLNLENNKDIHTQLNLENNKDMNTQLILENNKDMNTQLILEKNKDMNAQLNSENNINMNTQLNSKDNNEQEENFNIKSSLDENKDKIDESNLRKNNESDSIQRDNIDLIKKNNIDENRINEKEHEVIKKGEISLSTIYEKIINMEIKMKENELKIENNELNSQLKIELLNIDFRLELLEKDEKIIYQSLLNSA